MLSQEDKKRNTQPTQVHSSGRLIGSGVVPTSVRSDDRVSLFRPPSAASIGTNAVVCFQDWIDHRPGGLHCILAGEERSITRHGVAQKPFVGRFLSRLLFKQEKFSLLPDEFFSGELDASGEGDGRAGGEPEAQIVGPAGRWR